MVCAKGVKEWRGYVVKERDNFRYAEKCLYEYKRNVAGLKVLREDLRVLKSGLDVHAQNYQYKIDFTGTYSNPVHARLEKIDGVEERIRRLTRITEPITQLMADITAPEVLEYSENKNLMEILRLMYFGKNPPDAIMEDLRISRTTFFKQRRELVNMTISYLAI